MITGKIDVTKVLKEHLYQGKNGKYLDLVLFPLKEGPDEKGNTHVIAQSVSKEARLSGIKGPMLGRMKIEAVATPPAAGEPGTPDDDVPF